MKPRRKWCRIFLNLYKHKLSLAEYTSTKAYLYVILKNKITYYYRLEVMHQCYANYIVNHAPAQSISPLMYIETRELENILIAAIANLPPKCQEVFRLSREQYLSDKKIVAEMGILSKPRNSIRVRPCVCCAVLWVAYSRWLFLLFLWQITAGSYRVLPLKTADLFNKYQLFYEKHNSVHTELC